jgi:hypothetical protein
MEKAAAEEAAAAMAAAMAALKDSAPPVPLHKLPLQPITPTATLMAAASSSSQQQQACMDAAGNLQFYTHMFYKLPHLAKLAAAAEAAGAGNAEIDAMCSSTSACIAAAQTQPAAGSGNMELRALSGGAGPGISAGSSGVAGGSVTALSASAAEYLQQLKLAEVCLRLKKFCACCNLQRYMHVQQVTPGLQDLHLHVFETHKVCDCLLGAEAH